MFLDSIMTYDGAMLHERFAYRYFREKVSPVGNIIAFRGPMEVLADHMIDQEDLLKEAFIYSEDAINFLWEIPLLGNNAFGAVAYQRLFNSAVATILSGANFLNRAVIMRGDDIMVQTTEGYGKCSVSITYAQGQAALGHTGINIRAGRNAPDFAFSTQLSDAAVRQFAECVIARFYALNQDLFVATAKIGNLAA